MIYITLGDPKSIFIETLFKSLEKFPCEKTQSIVLIGSLNSINFQFKKLNIICEFKLISSITDASSPGLYFYDITPSDLSNHNSENYTLLDRGRISVAALEVLKDFNLKSRDVVITGPIDKAACAKAGFKFIGHTEYFADLAIKDVLMLLAGPNLKVGLVTQHISLKEVVQKINENLVVKKLELLRSALSELYKIPKPRIAICGLNPHCGDSGYIGQEEEEIIRPLIAKLKGDTTWKDSPPELVSGDTVFHFALQGRYDAVLAMYHDQGLAPLKTVHFEDAINISFGLPFLRLSPDHGPASDIFLQNKASFLSTLETLKLAYSYLRKEF
ncbi:MAG: 4-hydroxythreonine-4-phosphate dehydrogenase PdxA [Oligoflexales bacterium]|nr:4-hydroxythreonine-4-phosphate dehydrogenase PdxA [Oligoflexales bacterium]